MRVARRLCGTVVVLASALTWAQQAEVATREDVLKFFDVMRVRQSMEQVRNAAVEQAKASVRALIADELPHATPQQVTELEGMVEQMIQGYTIDNTIEDLVPIYQKHMTRADLEAMNAFFSSAPGQKFLDTEPMIASEAVQVVNAKTEKQIAASMAAIYKRIDQLKAQNTKTPARKAGPKKK